MPCTSGAVRMLVVAHVVRFGAVAPHHGRTTGQAWLVQVVAHSRVVVTARLERRVRFDASSQPDDVMQMSVPRLASYVGLARPIRLLHRCLLACWIKSICASSKLPRIQASARFAGALRLKSRQWRVRGPSKPPNSPQRRSCSGGPCWSIVQRGSRELGEGEVRGSKVGGHRVRRVAKTTKSAAAD